MPRLLIRWIVLTFSIWMLPSLFSGIHVDGFSSALAAAAIMGVLNVLVRPILIVITFPLTVLSLGLFLFVINAIIFKFAGALVAGLQVDSFGSAFLGALVVSLVSWVIDLSITKQDGKRLIVVRRGSTERPVIDLNPRDGSRWS